MSKKRIDIVEYIDKIVMAVVGILALYLLWAFVIAGPNSRRLDGRKLGPGQIDPYIRRQVEFVRDKLDQPAENKQYAKNKSASFSQKLLCSIGDVPPSGYFPLPGAGEAGSGGEERRYAVPSVPALNKVMASAYRAAARMPNGDVSPETAHSGITSGTADIDLVSVSARIDLQSLQKSFQLSFMNDRLPLKWVDSSLAEPVFARVELQRRSASPDGSWSDWQTVPLSRIDAYKQFQAELPMTTGQLTYGAADLFISQYKNNMNITKGILQPVWYDFTVARCRWLPPEYYNRYIEELDRQEQQSIREQRQQRLKERLPASPARGRDIRPPARPTPMMESQYPAAGAARAAKPESKPEDVLKEFESEVLTDQTDMSKLSAPLLIWAYDDTVRPDSKYQYRIRYGVFNPIAGKNWFLPEYRQYQDQIVLWSPFAEISDIVQIPKILHVFPMELLADAPSGLKVEVYKYHLGYWRNQDFRVFPGQTIGRPVQAALKSPAVAGDMMTNTGAGTTGQSEENIDYTTSWTMVDIIQAVDWAQPTGITRRAYPAMLYTIDGFGLPSVPVGKQNWPRQMQKEYNDVKQAQQKELSPSDTGQPYGPSEKMTGSG